MGKMYAFRTIRIRAESLKKQLQVLSVNWFPWLTYICLVGSFGINAYESMQSWIVRRVIVIVGVGIVVVCGQS